MALPRRRVELPGAATPGICESALEAIRLDIPTRDRLAVEVCRGYSSASFPWPWLVAVGVANFGTPRVPVGPDELILA